MEEIILLHTNDLHSHLENWPKIRRYIKHEQEAAKERGQDLYTIDLGDFVDRSHPLTEATKGQGNVRLMNQVDYDVATIGNNEGVGMPKEELNHLYDEANFPVVIDNLIDPETGAPPVWSVPYHVVTTKEGTRIGFFALTAPFVLTYQPNGWWVQEVDEVLPKLIKTAQEVCDFIVFMSHLGWGADCYVADNYPEIPVIIGSHTHHLLERGRYWNQSFIAAAGKYGYFVGKVTLKINEHQVVECKAEVIPTVSIPENALDQKEIKGYYAEGKLLLEQQVVADLPYSLGTDCEDPRSLISEGLKAVKERGKTEVAILNSGLFLQEIPKGKVNQYQLHQTLPHPMHLIRVTLKGGDLWRLIGEMEKSRFYLRHFNIQGMGFRGENFGEICYDGIRWDKKSKEVFWLDEPLDFQREYSLTTVDHYMFIPFFPSIELAGKVEFIFPEFIRGVMSDYLKRHYPIDHIPN